MGAPRQQRRVLRLGVIQGGRIVEERMIHRGENVTIGDGQKNTFVLHSSGLPKRFRLFVATGGRYVLCFTDDMDGKVSMDGGIVMGFDEVRRKSRRTKEGVYQFALTPQMRGKITIAESTILFQFVPAAIGVPKRARRGFGLPWHKRIDTTFVGIFVASLVLHTTVMSYSLSLPPPKALTLEEVPDRFARIIVPNKPKQVEEKKSGEADTQKDENEEEKPEEKQPENRADTKDATQNSEQKPKLTEEQRREKRREELKKVGILRVLGSKFSGNSRTGISGDNIFATADASAGLGELIDRNAEGIATASTAEQFGLRATSDTSLIGSGDVDGIASDAEVETEKRVAKRVPKAETGESDILGSMARATLDQVIKRNLPSVTACYDKALKLNPNLSGKIYIEFTVSESGRISAVSVRAASGTVTDKKMIACIKGRVRRWRFPASEEGSTDVSLPIVLTSS